MFKIMFQFHLHSIMVLLKLLKGVEHQINTTAFTFHYGIIKINNFKYKKIYIS